MAPLSLRSTFKLNSGFELPLLGFGVSPLQSANKTQQPQLLYTIHPVIVATDLVLLNSKFEAQIPALAPLPSLTHHPDSYPDLTFHPSILPKSRSRLTALPMTD